MNKVLLFSLLLLGGVVNAQITTDRPDQTESSSVVGAGILQLEAGVSYETSELEGGIHQERLVIPNMLWRLGVTDRFELRVVTQSESLKQMGNDYNLSAFGISDLEIGFKYNILKGSDSRPDVGFLAHAVVPSGTAPLGSEKWGFVSKLALTHNLGDKHSIGWNLGYNYQSFHELFYSVAWGVSLNDRLGVYLEAYGDYSKSLALNGDAGFTYLFNDDIQFDYSFGIGINNPMNYHSLGCSIRMGNKSGN